MSMLASSQVTTTFGSKILGSDGNVFFFSIVFDFVTTLELLLLLMSRMTASRTLLGVVMVEAAEEGTDVCGSSAMAE